MITATDAQNIVNKLAPGAGAKCTVADDSLTIRLGRFSCSFRFVNADGGVRTRAEVETLIAEQLANVVRECSRKPRSGIEIAEDQRKIAADARLARLAAAQKHHDALDPVAKARVEYIAKFGESDYADAARENGDPLAMLDTAARIGAVDALAYEIEKSRLEAWKRRCEERLK